MPRIAEDETFTQIVQFGVAPDRQAELIAAIVGEVERWVRHRRGFVSATFHASLDGRQVLNYAQWRTEADFEAFTKDPEGRRLGALIHAIGPTGPTTMHCRVARSIESPTAGRTGDDHA